MVDPSKSPRSGQARPADPPDSPFSVGYTEPKHVQLSANEPFALEAGGSLRDITVEYETYGSLSPKRDNVILICHGFSADAHAAGWDRNVPAGRTWRSKGPGWWDAMIGPGKPLDTNRFFILCSNFLGGCFGTTGPASINPVSGKSYALDFPVVTVGDWVRLQAKLLDVLHLPRIFMVVGGSMGGVQALEWALQFPERVERAVILAASPRLSAQGLAFNAVGRQAIMNDPNFHAGNYYAASPPTQGLGVARMMAHITFLSEQAMHAKFGRRLQDKSKPDFHFGVEFQVESYLAHQGRIFAERFDANSYLYLTRAMDYYDAAQQWGGGDLIEACRRIQSKIMAVSFATDWLYPPADCKEFALAMCRAGKSVTYVDVPSRFGHDAFLVETAPVSRLLRAATGGPW
ncbi:MAG TPA: homoserine O-acetyltransferase [Tepidisphaeraceae bacterium]|jgi:homoserine O-acetyltransferase|nr:homoserine O-acetyltransferase [Tepidisphaeraceae bacterium]